jgi:hypothetical protein
MSYIKYEVFQNTGCHMKKFIQPTVYHCMIFLLYSLSLRIIYVKQTFLAEKEFELRLKL